VARVRDEQVPFAVARPPPPLLAALARASIAAMIDAGLNVIPASDDPECSDSLNEEYRILARTCPWRAAVAGMAWRVDRAGAGRGAAALRKTFEDELAAIRPPDRPRRCTARRGQRRTGWGSATTSVPARTNPFMNMEIVLRKELRP